MWNSDPVAEERDASVCYKRYTSTGRNLGGYACGAWTRTRGRSSDPPSFTTAKFYMSTKEQSRPYLDNLLNCFFPVKLKPPSTQVDIFVGIS